MAAFGIFGAHVVQWWRLTRRRTPPALRDPAHVALKGTDGRPLGIVAELDFDRTYQAMQGIDWMRAEPLDRLPTQSELDDLADTQRELSRQLPTSTGLVRGTHEDSGVVSATPPVPRERF